MIDADPSFVAAVRKAIDEAAADDVKRRFANFCENIARGEDRDKMTADFRVGIDQIADVRNRALAAVAS